MSEQYDPEVSLAKIKANIDELLIIANSEEVGAAVRNLTEDAANLVDSLLTSVADFLNSLGD